MGAGVSAGPDEVERHGAACQAVGVRVLIAPDCFTGTLSAAQAAEAMALGWRRSAPQDELTLLPLSDGGPGFLDVVERALGGTTIAVTVSDPLGRPVPAAVLVVESAPGSGERTAYVESAQACGLHLLDAYLRNPQRTSTYGVGELLEAALGQDVRRIVVGLGGSGTNDGGAGMLAALGAGSAEDLAGGGGMLADLGQDSLPGLEQVRERFRHVELLAATDVDIGLLGFHGATASFAAQKGATPEQEQQLEGALGHFVDVVARALPPANDLLTGSARRLEREPGAGAAGGLGYGLLLLGGRRVSGVDEVLRTVQFSHRLASCDLVLTGEGCFDWQSLRGKVVAGVAQAALATAVPVVLLAGQVLLGRRETMALGISGSYAVAADSEGMAAALADPAGTLTERAARVARTWSPH